MKSIGVVRKVDELGRIVMPIELRRALDIAIKDSIEFFVDGDKIVLKKIQAARHLLNDGGNYLRKSGVRQRQNYFKS